MKPADREALDAYYHEAGSWAEDRQHGLRSSRRTAWIIAAVATTVALCEALALVALTPLKTVVPYTLMVDRSTGYVQALRPLDAKTIAPDAALTQSFLVQYVIAREGFDVDSLQADYRKVALWSADMARADYLTQMRAGNPDSPLVRLPHSTVIAVRVKSVSPLGPRAALVRFDTQRRDAGAAPGAAQPRVAVIRYRFSGEPMRLEDRFVNPLGFQVVRYRRDEEAPPPPEPVGPPAVPSPPRAAPPVPRLVPAP